MQEWNTRVKVYVSGVSNKKGFVCSATPSILDNIFSSSELLLLECVDPSFHKCAGHVWMCGWCRGLRRGAGGLWGGGELLKKEPVNKRPPSSLTTSWKHECGNAQGGDGLR